MLEKNYLLELANKSDYRLNKVQNDELQDEIR